MKLSAAVFAGLLVLAGCGGAEVKLDAANDIHAFLVAVRENDRRAFEAHIDRPALRKAAADQLREALGDQAGALGAALGGGAIEDAADRLITPETFQAAAQAGGLERTPTGPEIATQLRVLDAGRVCLPVEPGSDQCALTFAEQGGRWKLVDIDASGVRVSGAPGGGGDMQQAWPSRP